MWNVCVSVRLLVSPVAAPKSRTESSNKSKIDGWVACIMHSLTSSLTGRIRFEVKGRSLLLYLLFVSSEFITDEENGKENRNSYTACE